MKVKAKRKPRVKQSTIRPLHSRIATELDYEHQMTLQTNDVPMGSCDINTMSRGDTQIAQESSCLEGNHSSSIKTCQESKDPNLVNANSITFTLNQWIIMNDAAKRIQYFYFHKKYDQYMFHAAAQVDPENDVQGTFDSMDTSATDRPRDEETCHIGTIPTTVNEISPSSQEESMACDQKDENVYTLSIPAPAINPLDAEIEVPWIQPSWSLAKKFEAETHPRKSGKKLQKYNWKKDSLGRHCTFGGCGEQLDLWDEGVISEFSQFGSGITNYFKFLKWCCWVMFILSILHLPAVIINIFGRSMHYASNNALARTTLGNLGGAQNVTVITIPGCNSKNYNFDGACAFEKDHVAFFYAVLDGTGTVFMILAWIWLRIFEKKEVTNLNRSTVDASDYTLRVQNIPPQSTERELSIHFAGITGEEVADVNLAFANADEIREYIKRGQLVQERYNCVQRIRYEKAHQKGESSVNARLKKLLKERDRLSCMIEERDKLRLRNGKTQADAIEAFVTFETEEGFVKAMSAYQLNWFRSLGCIYAKRLKLKGFKVRVMQAPEPSTIIWENFEIKSHDRFFRKCVTTGIAVLAIFFSILFTFRARDFKLQTIDSMSGTCPDSFMSLSSQSQYNLIQTNQQFAHCYCSSLRSIDQWQEPLCRSHVKHIFKSSSMSYATGFMICFMNILFTVIMDRAGTFERHESIDTMEKNIMTRVFFLKFINTGCLVLLYNQRWLQKLVGVRFQDPQSFNLDWYETGGVSIIIVMTMNIITPHIMPLLSYNKHQTKLRKLQYSLLNMPAVSNEFHGRIWYSQDELNAQFLGPNFQLNYRYSQILVTFYICWVYAISMPILPLIGAISFFISYWVDKFLFCNFYRTPLKYSDDIGQRSSRLIGFCILLHLIVSCWILGNGEIFVGRFIGRRKVVDEVYKILHNIKITDILTKRHIVLLELTLVAFLGGIILYLTTSRFRMTMKRLWMFLTCSSGDKVEKLRAVMNTVQIKYSNAHSQGIIKGLSSYNILKNPKYQNAFAISSEFATAHRRLSAIRGFGTKEANNYENA